MSKAAVVGVVSYCANVGSIWSGMRSRLATRQFDLSFRLFDTYEAQNRALLKGEIDIAWNGPLAHCQLELATMGQSISLGMRDSDRDFQSVVVVHQTMVFPRFPSLVFAGTIDSPQAFILPFLFLREHGVDLSALDVESFEADLGKHGDTALGEVEVLNTLLDPSVPPIAMGLVSEMMLNRCERKNELKVLHRFPKFDHCQFDCLPSFPLESRLAFQNVLKQMDMNLPEDKEVMEMEGIVHKWEGPRETGYDPMRRAIGDWFKVDRFNSFHANAV